MKILILAPYPLDSAPSQRFRFEHFLKFMEEKGIRYQFQSFLSTNGWNTLYQPNRVFVKSAFILLGFLRRIAMLFSLPSVDFVLIHREATPIGPPVFEWLIAKVLRKPIIYDFDDAIWLPDPIKESSIKKRLKWRSKVARICSWSSKVTAGNAYLAKFASKYCDEVTVFPTVVDTQKHQSVPSHQHQEPQNEKKTIPIIGWTGSHSTLIYLEPIIPVLQELEKICDYEFVVIANQDPQLQLQNYRFVKWSKENEIRDLKAIDIGIMPLEDSEWSLGKCGFKLIQYLAMGIPAVASPVGVNNEIIQNETNGYLAKTPEEWKSHLEELLANTEQRNRMGAEGRKLIVERYSVTSQKEKFLNSFQL